MPLNDNLSYVRYAGSTNDILASALACTGTTVYRGSGSSYTGVLPENNFKWGAFVVIVADALRYVWAQSSSNNYAINFYNGSSWTGWKVLASTNSVPSYTGSTYSLGAVSANGYGKKDYTIAIPSGYKTTPICSINMVDGAMYTNGLTLVGNVSSGQTGNATVSVEYRTVGAITSGNDRFQFYVMIIPV